MRKLLKRFVAAASAVVIGGVTCVTSWFSVPVSAAAGVGWLEWLEFQTLLQGIGVGGSNSDFADSVQDWIDGIGGPEMPREEYDGKWMTNYEYYSRVGWDSIIDWFDGLFSGDNAYSDIADVGADVSGGLNFYVPDIPNGFFSSGGISIYSASNLEYPNLIYGDSILHDPFFSFLFSISSSTIDYSAIALVGNQYHLFVHSVNDGWHLVSKSSYKSCQYYFCYYGVRFTDSYTYKCRYDLIDYPLYNDCDVSFSNNVNLNVSCSQINSILNFLGCSVSYSDFDSVLSYLSSISISDDISISGKKYVNSDNFVGPVYTYPAAQELYKSTGTAAGIRLDVQTQDGVPDIQAALDGAGVDTVDDLVAGVAAGTVPMSKVFSDAKVTPYVVADTTAGTVVTDLGVSATAAGVKAVGLTQELAVPKDLTNAATYSIKGKTWDPEMSKYKLPLFQYFPFCLPWDIYQVLAAFSADPVAPVFDVPVGKILSGVRSVDASKATSVSAKIDFGDDNWSKVFEIIRILECAGIIVGLCLVAVYLIHGGR